MQEPSDTENVADLAEEYVALLRQGQHPEMEDYVRRYPHLSRQIRDLFPTLRVVEDLAPDRDVSVLGEQTQPLNTPESLESLGDFRIVREVGRGGMGVVYEAEQVSLGRRVALKVLQHRDLPDAKHRIRFQREARSAARLHHTNIVPVFGVGEEGEMSYYVMQLIKGVGLDDLLDELRQLKQAKSVEDSSGRGDVTHPRNASSDHQQDQLAATVLLGDFAFPHATQSHEAFAGTGEPTVDHNTTAEADSSDRKPSVSLIGESTHLSGLSGKFGCARQRTYWGSVARIGLQVAEALQYAHEHSILHRDIKPSNLMLDNSGTVWVTDFGLAKATDQQDLTNTGDILGTLRYMPPEAFHSRSDQRSDVYSLGITIYEMLALRPAFDESDRHRLIRQVVDHAPTRLEQVDPEIPRDLVTIVHKCIERDPIHRYQSAQELTDDFARFLGDQPIAARRVSLTERVVRWSRRNRAMSAALAAIAALLILLSTLSVGFALWSQQQADLAEYAQYVSNIQTANLYIENGSMISAQRILGAIPHKYRDWEWAYLANKAWHQYTTHQNVTSEDTSTNTAAFWKRGTPASYREFIGIAGSTIGDGQFTTMMRPDGSEEPSLLLSSRKGTLEVHSVESRKLLMSFPNPIEGAALSGSVSPNGSKLIATALTGVPMLFDVHQPHRPPPSFQYRGSTISSATDWVWSPDNKYVVSAHFDKRIRLWNVETLKFELETEVHRHEVRSMHFDVSESGSYLWAACTGGTITKWSMPDGKLKQQWEYEPKSGLSFEDIAFQDISPDRKRVVATFHDDSSLIWDLEPRKSFQLGDPDPNAQTHQASGSNRRRAAVFSPDGSCVAIIRGLHSVMLHEVETKQPIAVIKCHPSSLRYVRFSPDGTKLLVKSEDGTVILWTPQSVPPESREALSEAHSDTVYQIDIDPTGNRVLSGGFDRTVCVSDLTTQELRCRYGMPNNDGHQEAVIAVDLHDDGIRAASLDRTGTLHVWNSATGETLFQIDPRSGRFIRLMETTGGGRKGEFFSFPAVLSTGLFSPNGLHLVVYQGDTMKVFDANTGRPQVALEGTRRPGWAVFSHDSQRVCLLEMDANEPGIWDVNTGKLLHRLKGNDRIEGHALAVCVMNFSPVDDRIVTGGVGRVIVWDSRTGMPLSVLPGATGMTSTCRFSADGQFVLTGTRDQIRVWNSKTYQLITTLEGHTGRIRDVRLSPDQRRLVSCATDDQVIVWDFATPKANLLVSRRRGTLRPLQAQWTPDSKRIVTAWDDGSVEVWAGAAKEQIPTFSPDPETFKLEFDQWRNHAMPSARD